MRKLLLASVAAVAFTATPALAQDGGNFNGARAEGVIGYDNLSDGSGQPDSSADGLLYGGAVGYDFQMNNVVIGIEGELTGSTADTRTNNLLVAGDQLQLDAGRDIYAGARVGFVAGERALIYAKGGYTNQRLDTRYINGAATTRIKENIDGFRVGAGVEYAVGPNLYLKGEYRYSNYSNLDNYRIDVDRHQVVGGVGIRF